MLFPSKAGGLFQVQDHSQARAALAAPKTADRSDPRCRNMIRCVPLGSVDVSDNLIATPRS